MKILLTVHWQQLNYIINEYETFSAESIVHCMLHNYRILALLQYDCQIFMLPWISRRHNTNMVMSEDKPQTFFYRKCFMVEKTRHLLSALVLSVTVACCTLITYCCVLVRTDYHNKALPKENKNNECTLTVSTVQSNSTQYLGWTMKTYYFKSYF